MKTRGHDLRAVALLLGLLAAASVAGTPINHSLKFDGLNDRLQVDPFPAITGPFTVEAWIRPGAQGGGINPRIVELARQNDTAFRLLLGGNQAGLTSRVVALELHFSATGRQDVTSGSLLLQPDEWYHLAGVFDGSQQLLYVDGILVGARAASGTLNVNTLLNIGTGGDSDVFDGLIDEVRLWDYGRGQSEITSTMFSALTGAEHGLLGYWDFNAGVGQIASDLTANANHARLGATSMVDVHDPLWVAVGAPVSPVPEPRPMALLVVGLIGIAPIASRRRGPVAG